MENENKWLTPAAELALGVLTNELYSKEQEFRKKKNYAGSLLESFFGMCEADLGLIKSYLSLDNESAEDDLSIIISKMFDSVRTMALLVPHVVCSNDLETIVKLAIAYAYSAIGDKKTAIKECPIILPLFKPESVKADLARAKSLISAALDKLDKEDDDQG